MHTQQDDIIKMIDDEISGINADCSVDLNGHTYKMHLLTKQEERKSRELVPQDMASLIDMFGDATLPTLSMALDTIDGHNIDNLFPADTGGRKKLLEWLDNKPTSFLNTLWFAYIELKEKHREAMKNVVPLS